MIHYHHHQRRLKTVWQRFTSIKDIKICNHHIDMRKLRRGNSINHPTLVNQHQLFGYTKTRLIVQFFVVIFYLIFLSNFFSPIFYLIFFSCIIFRCAGRASLLLGGSVMICISFRCDHKDYSPLFVIVSHVSSILFFSNIHIYVYI
jgi:hypothetical protein